eukprot:6213796-Pleurochrysis_carterae.AAC.4
MPPTLLGASAWRVSSCGAVGYVASPGGTLDEPSPSADARRCAARSSALRFHSLNSSGNVAGKHVEHILLLKRRDYSAMVALPDFHPQDSVRVVGRRRLWRVVMLGVRGVIVDFFATWQQPDRKQKVNRVLVVIRLEFDWGPKCTSPGGLLAGKGAPISGVLHRRTVNP